MIKPEFSIQMQKRGVRVALALLAAAGVLGAAGTRTLATMPPGAQVMLVADGALNAEDWSWGTQVWCWQGREGHTVLLRQPQHTIQLLAPALSPAPPACNVHVHSAGV